MTYRSARFVLSGADLMNATTLGPPSAPAPPRLLDQLRVAARQGRQKKVVVAGAGQGPESEKQEKQKRRSQGHRRTPDQTSRGAHHLASRPKFKPLTQTSWSRKRKVGACTLNVLALPAIWTLVFSVFRVLRLPARATLLRFMPS